MQSPIEPYFLARRVDQQPAAWRTRAPSRTMGHRPTFGIVLGGGIAFKSEHARIAPLIDFRMYGIFGSDPREGAYINLSIGFLDPAEGAPLRSMSPTRTLQGPVVDTLAPPPLPWAPVRPSATPVSTPTPATTQPPAPQTDRGRYQAGHEFPGPAQAASSRCSHPRPRFAAGGCRSPRPASATFASAAPDLSTAAACSSPSSTAASIPRSRDSGSPAPVTGRSSTSATSRARAASRSRGSRRWVTPS